MFDWLKRTVGLSDTDAAARLSHAAQALSHGDDAEAVRLLAALIAARPADGEALRLRAIVACRAAQFEVAAPLLERAVAAQPAHVEAWLTLAEVRIELGAFDAAIVALRSALAIEPTREDAHRRLLFALDAGGQADAAIEYYQLLRMLDWHIDPATNPVAVLHAQARLVEAEALLEGLTRRTPTDAIAHLYLGGTRQARGHLDPAIASYQEAVRLDPTNARAQGRLAFALDSDGEVDAALDHYRRAAALQPDSAQAWSDYLAARIYTGPHSRAESATACGRYNERFGHPTGIAAPVRGLADAGRRLRIGYVSNDFCEQSIASFLPPVLEHHDRAAFEVFCYDRTAARDGMSQRYRELADHWRDVLGRDFGEVAAQVRADGIDVLVDLKGHFEDNHLPLFARRPAPLQLTWLGYPDTTGLEAMDGWITDQHIAADLGDQYASESLLTLPEFFMAFRPRDSEVDPGPLPAAARGHVTFGCFNQYSKVSPAMRSAMLDILAANPETRLLVTAIPRGAARDRLAGLAKDRGVDPARIECRSRTNHAAFLAWHQEVDIALDSFPYNGTTTSLYSLWMGVPLVVMAGQTHVSRVGSSILRNLGLECWIAADAAGYVRIATAVTGDREALARLRSTLRETLRRSAIMDEHGFTRRLETAIRQQWRQRCETGRCKGETRLTSSPTGSPDPW